MANQLATLPLDTLNKALQFIASQPYGQVAELVSEIQQNVTVTESDGGEAEEEVSAE